MILDVFIICTLAVPTLVEITDLLDLDINIDHTTPLIDESLRVSCPSHKAEIQMLDRAYTVESVNNDIFIWN